MTFPPNQDTDYSDRKEVGQTKAGYPLWKKHVYFYLMNLLVTWSDSNWPPIKITPFHKMKLVEDRTSQHDKEI